MCKLVMGTILTAAPGPCCSDLRAFHYDIAALLCLSREITQQVLK